MIEFIRDFYDFLRCRKKYWLIPLIIILVAFGVLVVATQTSVIAPFIYTVF